MKTQRISRVLATVVSYCLLTAVGAESQPTPKAQAPSKPRVVVLVTVDSLRADAVTLPGEPRKVTTYLTRLVYGGAVLPRVYAPSSQSAPSMASLFTGLYPASHGVRGGVLSKDLGEIVGQPALSDDFTTLAERMKLAGYTTIGVPASRDLSRRLGFAQGFDYYADEAHFPAASRVNREVYRLLAEAYGSRWRTELKNRHTFLWINYVDARLPYLAKEPWIHSFADGYRADPESFPAGLSMSELEKTDFESRLAATNKLKPLYQSEVASVDASLRRLTSALELDAPDVALIVTSSHGEELAEHGGYGHGATLYEEVVRVPLVVRWPEGVRAFTRVDEPASLLDIFPTLMDICKGSAPYGLQGTSLASAIRDGQGVTGRRFIFELSPSAWDGGRPWIGMIEGQWKLVQRRLPEGRKARKDGRLLFDLTADPKERRNVAAANPELVQRLEESLEAQLQSLPEPPSTGSR